MVVEEEEEEEEEEISAAADGGGRRAPPCAPRDVRVRVVARCRRAAADAVDDALVRPVGGRATTPTCDIHLLTTFVSMSTRTERA